MKLLVHLVIATLLLLNVALAKKKDKKAADVPLTAPFRLKLNHAKFIDMLKFRDQEILGAFKHLRVKSAGGLSDVVLSVQPTVEVAAFDFDYAVS